MSICRYMWRQIHKYLSVPTLMHNRFVKLKTIEWKECHSHCLANISYMEGNSSAQNQRSGFPLGYKVLPLQIFYLQMWKTICKIKVPTLQWIACKSKFQLSIYLDWIKVSKLALVRYSANKTICIMTRIFSTS